MPRIPSNLVIYEGLVHTVAPTRLVKGATVVAKGDGIGQIVAIHKDWRDDKVIDSVEVMLYQGYIKYYKPLYLQQYVVLHKPMNQFINLSPQDYRYIYQQAQPVKYRITARHYAMLTDESKSEYDYAKKLSKTKNGLTFLRGLGLYGLEIRKKSKNVKTL